MARLTRFFDPFIGFLVGTVVLASLLPARGAWADRVDVLADIGIVLLFFIHGAKLSRRNLIDGGRNLRLQLAVLACTFLVFPVLGLALSSLPMLSASLATGFLFLALLPSTVQSSIALTAIARGNVAAAVCSATFSNFAGIFITPLLVGLLLGGAGELSIMASVQKIVLNLLLPFLAGHLLRPLVGDFIARHKKATTMVDRGSILLVVYSAFGAAVVGGIWSEVGLADLVWLLCLNAVLLAAIQLVIHLAGRMLGLAQEDRVVLLMCGSVKSLAAGVPMAGVLFPAAGVGAIILPLMIFHQMQLITCAIQARHMAAAPSGEGGEAPLPAAQR